MSYNHYSAAILMVGGNGYAGTVNPLKPHDHWLYGSLIGHVMQKGDRVELWTGCGDTPYYKENERVEAHHDQSGRTKGIWTCTGAVKWSGDDREVEVVTGWVPDKKIKMGVFK